MTPHVADVSLAGASEAAVQNMGATTKHNCTWPGCSFVTTRRGHLRRHILTHTGERPHVCPAPGCGYTATQSAHLKTHLLTHSGQATKQHACTAPGCRYRTNRKEHLTRHIRLQHGVEGDDASQTLNSKVDQQASLRSTLLSEKTGASRAVALLSQRWGRCSVSRRCSLWNCSARPLGSIPWDCAPNW